MRIAATGIVTNEYNDILLIQRDDTRTWSAPGGSLEAGELPTNGVAREVREETGMIVLPVRLVSTSYWLQSPHPHLHLTFRCLIRGGEPTPSAESLRVGFFNAQRLPRPMLKPHRERVERARFHDGPATWFTDTLPWYTNWVRAYFRWVNRRPGNRQPARASAPAPLWTARAFVVVADEAGSLLGQQANGRTMLPGGPCLAGEAPWDAARRLTAEQTGRRVALQRLTGLYVRPGSTELTFVFTGRPDGQQGRENSDSFTPLNRFDDGDRAVIAATLPERIDTVVAFWSDA